VKKNNSGFTLVELLIVILLLTVIAVISSDMVINLTGTSTKIQNKLNIEEDYSFLEGKLSKIIQDADSVSWDTVNKKLIINSGLNMYELKIDTLANSTVTKLFMRSSASQNFTQLSNSDITTPVLGSFVTVLSIDNPQTVQFNFDLNKDLDNVRLKQTTNFKKIITVNKTYKQ